jgi:hypothetical protein
MACWARIEPVSPNTIFALYKPGTIDIQVGLFTLATFQDMTNLTVKTVKAITVRKWNRNTLSSLLEGVMNGLELCATTASGRAPWQKSLLYAYVNKSLSSI